MTALIIVFGMLTAFWSGFYIGLYKKEGKAPNVPIVTDLTEFTEEIIDKVRDSLGREKESKPTGFYD